MLQYLNNDASPSAGVVATAKAVSQGDLVGVASNTIITPSDQAWDTNLSTTQAAFVALFIGVSAQAKTANVARVFGNSNDNRIMFYTGGEYLCDVVSATYSFGDYLGPGKDTGSLLYNSTLAKVTPVANAVAVVLEGGTTVTQVRARLRKSAILN